MKVKKSRKVKKGGQVSRTPAPAPACNINIAVSEFDIPNTYTTNQGTTTTTRRELIRGLHELWVLNHRVGISTNPAFINANNIFKRIYGFDYDDQYSLTLQ